MLFDLDGTLWDASESTAKAWSEVFTRQGLPGPVSSDQIRSVAGKPYLECLRIICPEALDLKEFDSLLDELSVAEQEWMKQIGGDFYPGAIDAVREISVGYPVFLVSNCNDWYLEAFLDHSGLRGVFSEAICYGSTGRPKADNIRLILEQFNIGRGFYIGDTRGDMEASMASGIRYVHMSLGFGGTEMENSWHILEGFGHISSLMERVAETNAG